MNQQERCLWLIRALLEEMPQYRDTPIPALPDHRWRLLRSLMNVRPPMQVSEEFLQIQDAFLKQIPVRYPFGHGLSYTTFEYGERQKDGNTYTQTITNTGSRFGGEVVQLYLDGELKGFAKVYLNPGESKTVTITVEEETQIAYPDTYTVPSLPKSYPITLESRFTDLQQSFMGRILFNAVLSVARGQMKKAEKMPAGPEKENARKGALFLKRILESNSLRSMSMSAGQSMPWHVANGMMEMANGHLIKGIKCFLSPVKVPKLPKDENT